MMTYSYYSYNDLFQSIENSFNDYSQKNKLNVTLRIEFFSNKNTTNNRYAQSSAIDQLLLRRSTKYDLYIFDPTYLKKLSSHFIDLKDWLPSEYIDSYSLKDIWKICIYENKWIGLPLFIKFMVLYSNSNYLKKYNEEIPTTWDKLLETGKRILKQEQSINNSTNYYGYNGLFPINNDSTTSSMCSFYQYIYSFRENINSSFPVLNSQIAIDALNKLKEIKEKISTDEIFKLNEDQTVKLMSEEKNILFSVFWDSIFPNDFNVYKRTVLPGRIDGISGSCIGGYNIGISRYVNDNYKKASVEVLKYIFSKDFQKEIIVKKFNKYSGMIELYSDKEVCSILECDILNSLQFIERPVTIKNYDEYELKVLRKFYDFLYGNETATDVLQYIVDLTELYYMNLKEYPGKAVFIVINILYVLVLSSLLVKYIPKFSHYYTWFSNCMVINYIITSFFFIYSVLAKFGEPTMFKCHAYNLMIFTGYTMIYVPTLYHSITFYPKKVRYFEWIKSHEWLFIYHFYIYEGIFFLLAKIQPSFKVVEVIVENSKNFYQCRMDPSNIFGLIILFIEILFHAGLFLIIVILLFLEINDITNYSFVKGMSYILVFDIIGVVIVTIIRLINIKIYYVECIYPFIILGVFLVKHVYFLYIRLFLEMSESEYNQEEEHIIKKIHDMEFSSIKNIDSDDKIYYITKEDAKKLNII